MRSKLLDFFSSVLVCKPSNCRCHCRPMHDNRPIPIAGSVIRLITNPGNPCSNSRPSLTYRYKTHHFLVKFVDHQELGLNLHHCWRLYESPDQNLVLFDIGDKSMKANSVPYFKRWVVMHCVERSRAKNLWPLQPLV